MPRYLEKTIDVHAFKHNLKRVRHYAPHSQILAMVKANAYGHDLMTTAHHLDPDAFGIAHYKAGITLREHGIKKPIVVMSGFFTPMQLIIQHRYQLIPIIHAPHQLKILAEIQLPSPISVWLKVDTGMHRLGFSPDEFKLAYDHLIQNPNIIKPFVVMSHLACSDEAGNSHTQQQIQLFEQLTRNLNHPRSLANSGAIIDWPNTHLDWVRPGLMLYGISPIPKKVGADFGLKPVMKVTAPLIAIHDLHKGDKIGYGATWECPEDMRVGVVAVGYGDGYPRHAKSGTPIFLRNKQVPIVGRVSMDMITVDLRTTPDATIGDVAELWGPNLPCEIVAKWAGTIPYELVCNIR